jgi:hypothetical protein
VNQVGEESDAAAGQEDRKLSRCRDSQDREREADRNQARARALDARVDQAVGVAVIAVVMPVRRGLVDVGSVVVVV